MAKIFYDRDGDLSELSKEKIAVIGFGNQGRAHALNLRDSGLNVIAAARAEGKAFRTAQADGFETLPIKEAAATATVLAIMLPDEQMPKVFQNALSNLTGKGKTFVFAHGFAVANKTIELPEDADVILVAPTGPGRQVRSLYLEGKGLPALIAAEQDNSGCAIPKALAYAKGIGSTRAGAIMTTFAEETTTDLFCEQAVLCGGMPELIKASFDTLVERGYQPELAYISCLKEVKLIADLLFNHGIDGMRKAISNTAKFGSVVAGPSIINSDSHRRLANLLTNIESGSFAKSFMTEAAEGLPRTREFVAQEANSRLARVGKSMKETLIF